VIRLVANSIVDQIAIVATVVVVVVVAEMRNHALVVVPHAIGPAMEVLIAQDDLQIEAVVAAWDMLHPNVAVAEYNLEVIVPEVAGIAVLYFVGTVAVLVAVLVDEFGMDILVVTDIQVDLYIVGDISTDQGEEHFYLVVAAAIDIDAVVDRPAE
jgi:hypothetical protein